jgi:hypothetical protein
MSGSTQGGTVKVQIQSRHTHTFSIKGHTHILTKQFNINILQLNINAVGAAGISIGVTNGGAQGYWSLRLDAHVTVAYSLPRLKHDRS